MLLKKKIYEKAVIVGRKHRRLIQFHREKSKQPFAGAGGEGFVPVPSAYWECPLPLKVPPGSTCPEIFEL